MSQDKINSEKEGFFGEAADTLQPSVSASQPDFYKGNRLLSEYLLLHYGSERQVFAGLPGPREALEFPQRVVQQLLDISKPSDVESRTLRALDIGCAVGGSSFELSKTYRQVVGIDYSSTFITAANEMKTHRHHAVRLYVEGNIFVDDEVRLSKDIDPSRVVFSVGDAMKLADEMKGFDVVLAANLICRLPDPIVFLQRLAELVRPGGQLLLTSPFTWLESFTPRVSWLGDCERNISSLDAIKEILKPCFVLEVLLDLPFLIREHARKFQYGIACGMRWRRKR